jgi:hypothetical protein
MKNNFQHIGSLLGDKLKTAPWAKQITTGLIIKFAEELIQGMWGQAMDKQVKIVSLKKKILLIHCTNPIVAQEIKLYDARIVNAIVNKFGRVVERLQVV